MAFWSIGRENGKDSLKESGVDNPANPPRSPQIPENHPSPPKQLSPDEKIRRRFGTKLRSVLSEGTEIQGKLSFDTPVRIDGSLSGEVFSSSALIVGEKGVVDAKVEVETLIVIGKVKGSIKALEEIEVFPGGVVEADIETPLLGMDKAHFSGKCTMRKREEIAKSIVEGDSFEDKAPAKDEQSLSSDVA